MSTSELHSAAPEPSELPAKELLLCFESLGDNCEFGIVQARCGADPLGLLRFAATALHRLVVGITQGFDGIAEKDSLRLEVLQLPAGAGEYVLYQTKYDLVYHTFVFEGQMEVDELFAREQRRLAFLRDKFVEDLADARKIFVIKRNVALLENEIVPLWEALHIHGPTKLLWVVPADPSHPGGAVEVRRDGLLQGYLDRFAPYDDATNVATEDWVALCRNALEAARHM